MSISNLFKLVFGISFAIIFIRIYTHDIPSSYSEPLSVLSDPIQSDSNLKPFSYNNYTITPLADFKITAKILSRERYYLGRGADLSPVDFALGWGRMADDTVLESIDISQSGRWYRWHCDSFPIPRREIETHSANMHMIPQNDAIKSILLDASSGDIITLEGALVRVNASDGWYWNSSLSRNDTGNGACELVFVTSAHIQED
jgi:hypothetical protein